MWAKTLAAAVGEVERPYLRVALLCGVVLFLEGYDIAAVGYAIPSLVDAWPVDPSAFTEALAAGNVGLVLGSTGAGLGGRAWPGVGPLGAPRLRPPVGYLPSPPGLFRFAVLVASLSGVYGVV